MLNNFFMKTTVAIILASIPAAVGYSAEPGVQPGTVANIVSEPAGSPLDALTIRVSGVASSAVLSKQQKAEQITEILKQGIAAAITGTDDPAKILSIVLEYAKSAAQVAPQYAGAIATAASGFISNDQVPNATAMINATVEVAAKNALDAREVALAAPSSSRTPPTPEFGGNTSYSTVSPSR